MLGVEASPPEVGPDGSLLLTAHDYQPGSEPIAYRWTACPYSLGSSVAYACIDESLEVEIGTGSSAVLDLGPEGLGLRALLSSLGDAASPDGTARTLERGFDIWARLQSGPDCDGCESIHSVKRITVREATGVLPNQNPAIERFEVDGEPLAGEKVRLSLATDAPEAYVDPDTGEPESEEYLYTWYTSGGETDPGLSFGDARQTELDLPDEPGPVDLFVTVRDGRGGLAVATQTIEVR